MRERWEEIWRRRDRIGVAVVILLVGAGLIALHRLTQEVRFADVRAALHAVPAGRVALALLLTALSYGALTLYDVLALRMIGRPLHWPTAALASFTSYTLSHNLGLAPVTGGSARYRIYSAAGLDVADVARVVVLAGVTFWMGVATVTGLALLAHHGPLALAGGLIGEGAARAAGLAVTATGIGVVALGAWGPRRISVMGWSAPLPTPAQALAQIGIASLDVAAASAALFVLIPGADPALLPGFMLGYALAIIAVLVSHVPGGVGVFEAVVIAAVPVPKPALVAALIIYRVVYYLLPLALGVTALLWHEGRRRRGVPAALRGVGRVVRSATPPLAAAAAFAGGAVLLVSGSLPAAPDRLRLLTAVAPLPFVEASHMAASLAGTGLLLLAPGLYRRLDGAFHVTRALLVAGAIFSLLKGIDYEEAIICLAIAGLLQWARPAFDRRTELVARPLSPGWLASVAAVVGASVWIGFFSYKHVAYQDSLWWRFAWSGDAPRFLRASLGVAVTLAAAALWRAFGPARNPAGDTPAGAPPDAALARAERTDAMLALTGDKRFLVSEDGSAFLMYQVRGASWIVMADPVGPREAWPELLWRVRALSHAAQGRLLLYQISADALELAVEMGLHIVKYGEEAIVDLDGFALDGGARRSLRQSVRRVAKAGASFEVAPAADVPALLPELRAVSDAWLRAKGAREKRFSLGRFDPDYLRRFDCALVRHEGRIVAFANLWRADGGGELSVDLMRHLPDGPPGLMDFLFTELMAWGRAQGYRRFALGLAPLSGIDERPLSPVWAKVAGFVFRHGERVYGFRGLRAYKEKFGPRWEPRYIAGPGPIGMLGGLRDLSALIGGRAPAPASEVPAGRKPRALMPAHAVIGLALA